jgi:hypothetical protein
VHIFLVNYKSYINLSGTISYVSHRCHVCNWNRVSVVRGRRLTNRLSKGTARHSLPTIRTLLPNSKIQIQFLPHSKHNASSSQRPISSKTFKGMPNMDPHEIYKHTVRSSDTDTAAGGTNSWHCPFKGRQFSCWSFNESDLPLLRFRSSTRRHCRNTRTRGCAMSYAK